MPAGLSLARPGLLLAPASGSGEAQGPAVPLDMPSQAQAARRCVARLRSRLLRTRGMEYYYILLMKRCGGVGRDPWARGRAAVQRAAAPQN